MEDAFKTFDLNGDGEISREELKTALQNIGKANLFSNLEAIISANDKDNSGTIDYHEFLEAMKGQIVGGGASSERNEEDELRATFNNVDKDSNGFISAAELTHCLAEMGMQMSEQEIDNLIYQVDVDGDGKIGFEEFKTMIGQGA